MSCYRDLNPGPLPYQGSALPLSYNSKKKKSGRRGSNPRPSAWKANALSTELLPHSCQSCHSDCGQRWIRTTEVERQQIYSLPHLATLVFALNILDKELKSKSEQYSEHRCFILSSSSNSFPAMRVGLTFATPFAKIGLTFVHPSSLLSDSNQRPRDYKSRALAN